MTNKTLSKTKILSYIPKISNSKSINSSGSDSSGCSNGISSGCLSGNASMATTKIASALSQTPQPTQLNATNLLIAGGNDADDALSKECFLLNISNRTSNRSRSVEKKPMIRKDSSDIEIDDLELIRTIGTGSYGRVYLAKDPISNQHFALKKMLIKKLVGLRQIVHAHSEKRILTLISHPFIVKMYKTSVDKVHLNMVFDYIAGGELFSYLRDVRRFSNAATRFYCAEIVLALKYLHSHNIAYRDLKPENLMLDHSGHIKMTDFGFAKVVKDKTWTMCGTTEYLAPEVFMHEGHNQAVDWWSLGILIYEMLVGVPPFQGETLDEIFGCIRSGKLRFTRMFNFLAKDLVKRLLHVEQSKRLGNLKNGANDVMNHKWFADIVWDDLIERKISPPIVPSVMFDGDSRNFEVYDEDSKVEAEASEKELEHFKNW